MKNVYFYVLVIVFFAFNFAIANEETDYGVTYEYGEYKPGTYVHIFADKVNIREKPSTNSKVITKLSITNSIEIIVMDKVLSKPY